LFAFHDSTLLFAFDWATGLQNRPTAQAVSNFPSWISVEAFERNGCPGQHRKMLKKFVCELLLLLTATYAAFGSV